jgi:prophage maintenance system killer protein
MDANQSRGEVVLYEEADGGIHVDVRLERETLWLTQGQMAELFDKDPDTIGLHLRNIFAEKELDEAATTEDSSVVRLEGTRNVRRTIRFYNLDAIISVGYRVNSRRGTQFRMWATRVLRDHAIRGFTINERRLAEDRRRMEDLQNAIRLAAETASRQDLSGDEAKALLQVVGEYSFALDVLDDYDHERLPPTLPATGPAKGIDYDEALRIVRQLRSRFNASDLFGHEKDAGLAGALGAVMQTFEGRDLYPSLEDKAAHLLYFLTKSHPFVDGNKRIAAALFLWFLEKNGALYAGAGERRISDTALVALTLLTASSHPGEKSLITAVIAQLLYGKQVAPVALKSNASPA